MTTHLICQLAKKPKKVTPVCNFTAEEFMKEAKSLSVKIGDVSFEADPKLFKPGNFGWSLAGKSATVFHH